MSFFDFFSSVFSSTPTNTNAPPASRTTSRAGSRHHSAAVSDGLRRGSSDCGRVMRTWGNSHSNNDDDD